MKKGKGAKGPKAVSEVAVKGTAAAEARKDIEKAQELVRGATLGWAKFNTADSPGQNIALEFGHVNPRPLNHSAVNNLVKDFLVSGRDPVKNYIYVLVRKEWLEPGSYATDGALPWPQLPELRFTDQAYGVTVYILSGNHRTGASILLRDQLRKDKAKAEAELAKITGDSKEDAATREEYIKLIALLDAQIAECVKWGVILIDAGAQ